MTRLTAEKKKTCFHVNTTARSSISLGDSGGAAYFFDASHRPVVTGVTSTMVTWTRRDHDPYVYPEWQEFDIRAFCFTNVDAYRSFIDEAMR